MQAMTVFLLETFYRGTHMTKPGNKEIPKCIKKLLRWLQAMRPNNPVAERAYKLIVNILKSGESHVQDDITDLLAEDEADIDRGPSFSTYPSATLSPEFLNVFAPGQWQPFPYDTTVFPMPDPHFLPEQFQMPITYGNPFLTNFDQQNPFSITIDVLWRNAGEDSVQYPPSQ